MGGLTTSSLSNGPGSTKSRTLAITQHPRCRVRSAAKGAAESCGHVHQASRQHGLQFPFEGWRSSEPARRCGSLPACGSNRAQGLLAASWFCTTAQTQVATAESGVFCQCLDAVAELPIKLALGVSWLAITPVTKDGMWTGKHGQKLR